MMYGLLQTGYGKSSDHIRGSIHSLKLMLKAVFAIQVTRGAKIIVIALHTLPADTSDSLLCTPITYHITVSDTWRRIKTVSLVSLHFTLPFTFRIWGPIVIAIVYKSKVHPRVHPVGQKSWHSSLEPHTQEICWRNGVSNLNLPGTVSSEETLK